VDVFTLDAAFVEDVFLDDVFDFVLLDRSLDPVDDVEEVVDEAAVVEVVDEGLVVEVGDEGAVGGGVVVGVLEARAVEGSLISVDVTERPL
jgi:hypothetical protein